LVGGRRRRPPGADPVRRARRPDAVRLRDHRPDRVRGRSGDGAGLLGGAPAARPGTGAARAERRGAQGARVDRARRHDDPAVNVYFHTFGCKANQYDTEVVRQAFADQGAVLVDDPAAADLAVVNSCTVTHESETKLRRFVRGVARRGAKLETVVMGCAAALDEGRIAGLPSVRAVVAGADPGVVLAAAGMAHARPDPVLRRFHANARGWLKIQD